LLEAIAVPEPAPPKIRIAGLSKSFATRSGPFVALDGISLDIARGSFCTIVGLRQDDIAAHPRRA